MEIAFIIVTTNDKYETVAINRFLLEINWEYSSNMPILIKIIARLLSFAIYRALYMNMV